jgi:hypothetical protein
MLFLFGQVLLLGPFIVVSCVARGGFAPFLAAGSLRQDSLARHIVIYVSVLCRELSLPLP